MPATNTLMTTVNKNQHELEVVFEQYLRESKDMTDVASIADIKQLNEQFHDKHKKDRPDCLSCITRKEQHPEWHVCKVTATFVRTHNDGTVRTEFLCNAHIVSFTELIKELNLWTSSVIVDGFDI